MTQAKPEGGRAIRDLWDRARIRYQGKRVDGMVEPAALKAPYSHTKAGTSWVPGWYRLCWVGEDGFRHVNEADIYVDGRRTSLAEERKAAAPPPPPPPKTKKRRPPPPPPRG